MSFLPFPTKLMAEAIHESDAERVAVVFYGLSLLVISLLLSALWGAIAIATTPSIGFYVPVIVLAILAPRVAAFGYLVLGIILVLRARGDEAAPAETAEPL